MMIKNQIVKMRFLCPADAGFEGVAINATYQLIKNEQTRKDTLIYDNCYNKFIPFNIYKYGFIPTESVELLRKVHEKTQIYGNLSEKYETIRDSPQQSDKYSSLYPFPVMSITNKEISVTFSKTNHNKNDDKKLVLPNGAMGYPILDEHGILYPSKGSYLIIRSNNNLRELKLLQSFFYSDLVLYIIGISKVSMSFFNNKVFILLPDITKMVKGDSISEKELAKLFGFSDKDIKCYVDYKNGAGEGHLPENVIKGFKSFDLTKFGMTKEQIKKTKSLISDKKVSLKTRKKTNSGKVTKMKSKKLRLFPKII
jgi:hypothetical protein